MLMQHIHGHSYEARISLEKTGKSKASLVSIVIKWFLNCPAEFLPLGMHKAVAKMPLGKIRQYLLGMIPALYKTLALDFPILPQGNGFLTKATEGPFYLLSEIEGLIVNVKLSFPAMFFLVCMVHHSCSDLQDTQSRPVLLHKNFFNMIRQ